MRHCCPYGTYESMYHVSATNCTTTKPKEMICHLSQKTETRVPARGHGREGERARIKEKEREKHKREADGARDGEDVQCTLGERGRAPMSDEM